MQPDEVKDEISLLQTKTEVTQGADRQGLSSAHEETLKQGHDKVHLKVAHLELRFRELVKEWSAVEPDIRHLGHGSAEVIDAVNAGIHNIKKVWKKVSRQVSLSEQDDLTSQALDALTSRAQDASTSMMQDTDMDSMEHALLWKDACTGNCKNCQLQNYPSCHKKEQNGACKCNHRKCRIIVGAWQMCNDGEWQDSSGHSCHYYSNVCYQER